MPPPRSTQPSARYFLRPHGQSAVGPYEGDVIAAMLDEGRLDGSEDISTDGRTWRSVRTLSPPGATTLGIGSAVSAQGASLLDLGADLGISLAPLEIGFGEPRGGDSAAERFAGASLDADGGGGGPDLDPAPASGLGLTLELVERKPAPPPVPQEARAVTRTTRVGAPGAGAFGTDASATVASLLEGDAEAGRDATRPVSLDEAVRPVEEPVRRRTMTAARGGPHGPDANDRFRPSRRVVILGVSAVLIAALGAGALILDLPDRLRREPAPDVVLGEAAVQIARDRFPAFAEGARRLEEVAVKRRRAPAARAAAALLLASSVVIHGAERARIARAEALLQPSSAPSSSKTPVEARAQAWVALAKGRWKEAEQLAAEAPLAPGDRAVIEGWAALGRENAARATELFAAAERAEPPPSPSRAATRYALALAREADLSPAAEAAYHAVLAEAPAHVGAALGLLRVSKSSPAGRIQVGDALIAKQAGDASRAELAEAYALVARAARELGDGAKAEAALKRAREVDPASAAAAVAGGDALLAEGRTDEAVGRYKLALGAPVSAPRTAGLRFARVAALIETARSAEAAAALVDLDRRLPGDPRGLFWRGRSAERARPADPSAAEHAYREALAHDPRFLPASLQLARLLLDQHRGADAITVLRRAETQGTAPAVLRIALGQAQMASGNTAEAVRTFRQVRASDDQDAAAHLGLAGALEAQGDLEGARAELATLAARGKVPGLGSRVAEILIKLGRKEEALVAFQQEIAAGGAALTTKVAAARLALDLGRKDVARTFAESVVDDDPRTPGALLVLAEVRRAQGDLGSAIAELRRALAVDGSAEVQLEYGRALAALGRDEDALSALEQAKQIPAAGIERGRILMKRGEIEAAVKELAAATAKLPSDADAFLLLGQGEDRLGHVTRAEAAWKSALKLAPTSAEARYRLGRLQMDRGQEAAALPNLRSAAEHVSGSRANDGAWRVDLYFQLGFAETRQGSRDRALAAFRRYLELAPGDAPARVEVTRQIHEIVP